MLVTSCHELRVSVCCEHQRGFPFRGRKVELEEVHLIMRLHTTGVAQQCGERDIEELNNRQDGNYLLSLFLACLLLSEFWNQKPGATFGQWGPVQTGVDD